METSFGLLFYLKKPKGYSGGELPIYVRITVDGEPKELCTKRECEPSKWNPSAGRLAGKSDQAKELNAYLDTIQQKVFDAKKKLMEKDVQITAERIKCLVQGKPLDQKRHTIMDAFRIHNEQMKKLVGIDYADGTMERYQTSYDHTLRFLQERYQVDDLDVLRLDYEFITEYEFWLKTERRCSHNTTMKYLGNFKKIVNICLAKRWLTADPFFGYKRSKKAG